jgi:transcriptional regulator with XRE-family HTH domain
MDFDSYLGQKLENPEFRREWEAGEPAFQIIRAFVGARALLGWTQTELARRMGTNQANISRVENSGKASPEFLDRFAAAVGGKTVMEVQIPGLASISIAVRDLRRSSSPPSKQPRQRRALEKVVRVKRRERRPHPHSVRPFVVGDLVPLSGQGVGMFHLRAPSQLVVDQPRSEATRGGLTISGTRSLGLSGSHPARVCS